MVRNGTGRLSAVPYLLPFVKLLADITPLIEVGETLRNRQEPKENREDIHKDVSAFRDIMTCIM